MRSFTLVCQESSSAARAKVILCVNCLRKLGQWVNRAFYMPTRLPAFTFRVGSGAVKTIWTKEVLSEPFCADIGYTKGLVIIETSHRGVLHNNLLWHINESKCKRGKQKFIDFPRSFK